MLEDLELPQVQQIVTQDRRALAEHKPPGMDGSLLQNLGRNATLLVLRGVASGPDAATFVQKLDDKFRAARPVAFTADIVTEARIDQMVIDDLQVEEAAGVPERFVYTLALREFAQPVAPDPAPPEPPTPPLPAPDTATVVVELTVEGQPDFDFASVVLTAQSAQER